MPTYIYALVDARTDAVCYIGKSVNPPQRLSQHRRAPHNDELQAWVDDLTSADMQPEMRILEEVPDGADWRVSEVYWVRWALRAGWTLRNKRSGGDNIPIHDLTAHDEDIVTRSIYGGKLMFERLCALSTLMVEIAPKSAESRSRRVPHLALLHDALLLYRAYCTDSAYPELCAALSQMLLHTRRIRVGVHWHPGYKAVLKGMPIPKLGGLSIPCEVDSEGCYSAVVYLKKRTSDLLDDLSAEMVTGRRRGYDATLDAALRLFEDVCNRAAGLMF